VRRDGPFPKTNPDADWYIQSTRDGTRCMQGQLRLMFRLCACLAPKAQGTVSSPQITSSAHIYFSHFFNSWKQHRSGEGG
jgi:hypothetical protein